MRIDLPAVRGRGFAKSQQKSVVDIRQAEPLALAAPDVHENLERGDAEVFHVFRNAGELLFRRNDEVVGEIDPRAGVADVENFREHLVEGLGRHDVGNERRDAAASGRGRLLVGITGHARLGDVASMTEMQMRIHHAGEHHQTPRRKFFLSQNMRRPARESLRTDRP